MVWRCEQVLPSITSRDDSKLAYQSFCALKETIKQGRLASIWFSDNNNLQGQVRGLANESVTDSFHLHLLAALSVPG